MPRPACASAICNGEERWLAAPMQRDDQEGFAVNDVLPGYAFTPDSKAVLFTGDGHIKRVDIATRTSPPFHSAPKSISISARASTPITPSTMGR